MTTLKRTTDASAWGLSQGGEFPLPKNPSRPRQRTRRRASAEGSTSKQEARWGDSALEVFCKSRGFGCAKDRFLSPEVVGRESLGSPEKWGSTVQPPYLGAPGMRAANAKDPKAQSIMTSLGFCVGDLQHVFLGYHVGHRRAK